MSDRGPSPSPAPLSSCRRKGQETRDAVAVDIFITDVLEAAEFYGVQQNKDYH